MKFVIVLMIVLCDILFEDTGQRRSRGLLRGDTPEQHHQFWSSAGDTVLTEDLDRVLQTHIDPRVTIPHQVLNLNM